MGIVGKIVEVFTGPVESVIQLGEKAWSAIKGILSLISTAAFLLSGAWEWMVNGATWLVLQTEQFAREANAAVEHTLNIVIPKAIEWAIGEAWKLAAGAVVKIYNELSARIGYYLKLVLGLIYTVGKEAEALGLTIAKWANGAVQWVEQFGTRVWFLLSHPERLVKWIMGALVGPLVITLLQMTSPIFVWMFQKWTSHSSDLAHIAEDLLAKLI